MSESYTNFDVIVIGGGHAGCEAALAAARLGADTMLLSMNLDHVAQMSCNPAIGGIAKGQVVREIDALGGEMGRNTDATSIQFRMLNQSKGPAVWSPRAQCDKLLYQRRMKHVIERQERLFPHQAEAVDLLTEKGRITGVGTNFGETFRAQAVVVCSGTFLRGLLHYGARQVRAGRAGDLASDDLSVCLLESLGLELGRLKTGTPPRVNADGIDFSEMEEQPGDPEGRFSHWPGEVHAFESIAPAAMPRRSCYLLRTTARTRDVVVANIDQAPMYNGSVEGIGTRYCPSFEDKVMRFPEHETHQLFLEPEGAYTEEFYLNGLSTSLPTSVQLELLHSLPGMQEAKISRYAYAVEYDFVLPHQLRKSLALDKWPNLFLAGQVNGTTGYEEAAGQGLAAGINAALLAANDGRQPLVLGRDQAYIGVMIDDLATKEIVEPYRLFTSRAEHRLSLRQDNAWRRLSRIGHELGLLPHRLFADGLEIESQIETAREFLESRKLEGETLWSRLRRKELALADLDETRDLRAEARQQLEIEAHYEGYIAKEQARAAQLGRLEHWRIPPDFTYDFPGLRHEARAKLGQVKPETLAQAARIDGVTPAEIALLQVHLKRRATASPPTA